MDNCIFEGGSSSDGALFLRDSAMVSENVTIRDSVYGFQRYGSGNFTNYNITNISGGNYYVYGNYISAPPYFINSSFDEDRVSFGTGGTGNKSIVSINHNNVVGNYYIWVKNTSANPEQNYLFKSKLNLDFGTGDKVFVKSGNFIVDENASLYLLNISDLANVSVSAGAARKIGMPLIMCLMM